MSHFFKIFTLLLMFVILSSSDKADALDEIVQREQIKQIERFALILDVSGISFNTKGEAKVKDGNQFFYAASSMLTRVLEKQGYLVVCFKANDFDSFSWSQLEAKLDASNFKYASSASENRQIFVFVTAYGLAANNQESMYIYSPQNVSTELKEKMSSMTIAELDAQPELVSLAKLDEKIRSYGFHRNFTIYNFLSDTTTRDASGKPKVRAINLDSAKEHWNNTEGNSDVAQYYYQHVYLRNQSPDNSTVSNIYKTLYDAIDGSADAFGTLNKAGRLTESDNYVDASELLEYLRVQYGEEVVFGEKISANTDFKISKSRYSTDLLSKLIDEATAGTTNLKDQGKIIEYKNQLNQWKKAQSDNSQQQEEK